MRILIADDSSIVRTFVERAVSATGRAVEILTSADGQDAVRLLSQQVFDIAFLDVNMPQLGGVEVMAAIHLMGARTFAISMSDGLNAESERKLKAFGAYDFLAKPFSAAQVAGILDTYQMINTRFDVLVVDDSATVRRIVRKVLERSIFNLEIAEAEDGKQALERVRDRSFRVIFSDFNMPNMSGIDLADRLASDARGSDVILMSTEYNATLDQAAQKVRARAFLRKPFYPEDVDSILHHLFDLRHSHFSKQVRVFAMSA